MVILLTLSEVTTKTCVNSVSLAHRCRAVARYSRLPPTPASQRHSSSTSTADRLGARIAGARNLPLFRVPSADVTLLEHPDEFYKQLLGIIGRARKRVFLASLYIGKTEHDLIHHLSESLASHPELHVTILVDGLRSTREGAYQGTSSSESCASLLAALQARYPSRVEVRAYRAPDLPAWLERVVGKRFVEGWGLQHMKIYGGDDEVMISGANLSNDYFTNRRDRYLTIRDKRVSAYMYDVLMTASRYAYSLQAVGGDKSANERHAKYTLEWDEGLRLPVSKGAPTDSRTGPVAWKQSMHDRVNALTAEWHAQTQASLDAADVNDAVDIVPMLQMGPMRIHHETDSVPMVLDAANSLGRKCRLDFTTGYFSLNPHYAEAIVAGRFRSSMITAAPRANGFFGSAGLSRHLPPAYTWLEHRFWRRLKARGRADDVTISEWEKHGWTYHAKGLWLYPRHDAAPTVSLLGSSNFGIRSAKLDLECTLLVDAINSPALQARLGQEIAALHRDANDAVGEEMFQRSERKVHWGVKLAARCLRRML